MSLKDESNGNGTVRANGELSVILEKAIEDSAKLSIKILHSALYREAEPDSDVVMWRYRGSIRINGCKNRCVDIVLTEAGMAPRTSVTLDDAVSRPLGPCESCTRYVFPDIKEEEWQKLAEMMGQVVEEALK